MAINQVALAGNLTRDSELRSSQSGSAILNFGVAVNERRKNPQTGEWEDDPQFVDCVMFGTRAEKLHDYLVKGVRVALAGRLSYSSWERDGQRRSKLEVIVDDVVFMSRGEQAPKASGPHYGPLPKMPTAPKPTVQMPPAMQAQVNSAFQQAQPSIADVYDDDIPFD